MKLEKIEIDRKQYYQWLLLGINGNIVGDLFTNWREIESQKQRILLQNPNHNYLTS